jgi:hypothetical protein
MIIHLSAFYLKQRFGDWIVSPSSGGTNLVGSDRQLVPVSGHRETGTRSVDSVELNRGPGSISAATRFSEK